MVFRTLIALTGLVITSFNRIHPAKNESPSARPVIQVLIFLFGAAPGFINYEIPLGRVRIRIIRIARFYIGQPNETPVIFGFPNDNRNEPTLLHYHHEGGGGEIYVGTSTLL